MLWDWNWGVGVLSLLEQQTGVFRNATTLAASCSFSCDAAALALKALKEKSFHTQKVGLGFGLGGNGDKERCG